MDQVISFVSDFVYERIECDDQVSSLYGSLSSSPILLNQVSILGKSFNIGDDGFVFSIFENGKVEKKYIFNK